MYLLLDGADCRVAVPAAALPAPAHHGLPEASRLVTTRTRQATHAG